MEPTVEAIALSKEYRIGQGLGLWRMLTSTGRRIVGRASESENRLQALNQVDFCVHPGEVVGLVGRNGAGKSTLLRVLARITTPSSGRAIIRGRTASLLDVTAGFHMDLTGLENIYFTGAIMGMTKREIAAKLDRISAMAEVADFLTTPVKRYSTGMYLRLGIAIAAHVNADLLLFDEVLAAADGRFQRQCYDVLRAAAADGRSVIFVSHQLDLVEQLYPRTLLLKKGRLAVDGPTGEVLARYRDELSRDQASGELSIESEGG